MIRWAAAAALVGACGTPCEPTTVTGSTVEVMSWDAGVAAYGDFAITSTPTCPHLITGTQTGGDGSLTICLPFPDNLHGHADFYFGSGVGIDQHATVGTCHWSDAGDPQGEVAVDDFCSYDVDFAITIAANVRVYVDCIGPMFMDISGTALVSAN